MYCANLTVQKHLSNWTLQSGWYAVAGDWQIPVLDGMGRPRIARVAARLTGVVVLPPPGGGFTVEADRVAEFCEALSAARTESMAR
jgi:hypothetical protein